MEDWKKINEDLTRILHLATFPVAIHFIEDMGKVPEKVKRPVKDFGVRLAPCQGAAMARKYGFSMAISKEDSGCAIANHTYGWKRADMKGVVYFLTTMNYTLDEEAAKNTFYTLPALGENQYEAVVYTPLARSTSDPDVVLLYGNPGQIMRMIHGSTRRTGQPVKGSFSGRAASCTEGVLGAFLDKAPKVVVPGNGDRVWASCQDHEMAMAFPGAFMPELMEGLKKTHATGIRYPVPTFMGYEPKVGLTVPLSDIFDPAEIDKFTGRRKK